MLKSWMWKGNSFEMYFEILQIFENIFLNSIESYLI